MFSLHASDDVLIVHSQVNSSRAISGSNEGLLQQYSEQSLQENQHDQPERELLIRADGSCRPILACEASLLRP